MNLVFDLDGVVYVGNEALPRAGEVLAWADRAGHTVLFATNNSVRTPSSVVEKIRTVVGYSAHESQVITSALAAAELVVSRGGRRCLVVGEDGIREALRERSIDPFAEAADADHVVVGLTRELSYELLVDATTAVRSGATLIATNLDPTFPSPSGLRPGAGSIVAAVETSTDTVAIPAGKPFRPTRALIEAKASAGAITVIGDRPDTDLALGRAAGWHTVLCLSGVTAAASDVPEELRPDRVIDSIADLPEALAGLSG